MRTKTFKRDGASCTVETGFDEDGAAAIILTRSIGDEEELRCTLTLTSPAVSDTVFDFFNENNVWEWPRHLDSLVGARP